MQVTLAIEGNIGAGKSILIKILEKHFGHETVEFIQEPVELWKNCNGENLLGAFYSDPKKYAYLFQTVVMVSTIRAQAKKQTKAIRVTERSAASNMCFALNCVDNGLMNAQEFAAYKYWCQYLVEMSKKPTCYIYLRTSPETCFSRMNLRNRQEESSVSMEYLEQLHKQHEDWFASILDTYVIVDGNVDFEHDEQSQLQLINNIASAINAQITM